MNEARVVLVVMPQMGESLSEGTIVKWLKQPGDRIERDEPLFELSTDKVDTDVPAPAAGTLTKILAAEGETVAVGVAVAVIDVDQAAAGAADDDGSTPAGVSAPPATLTEEPGGHFKSTHAPQIVSFRRGGARETSVPVTSVPGTHKTSVPAPVPGTHMTSVPAPGRTAAPANRSFSPAVLGDAQGGGLSFAQLTSMSGSGRRGRVTKRDVRRFIESQGAAGALQSTGPLTRQSRVGPPPEFLYRPVEGDRIEPMSAVRKRIARHMRWSVKISPHASAQSEADMSAVTAVMEHRHAFAAQHGVPMTYTVLAAAVSLRALHTFPVLNSSVVGDQIVIKPTINLAIAVALPDTDDLIVPVVRRADELSLVGLARAIHDLATRARARQLRPEDVQDGTFTLTNPGIFGGITGTPILNQPQVAILSLGSVRKQAVVVDDAIVIRPMMALTLTFDHRATDGMVAFRFLARMRELLEKLPSDLDWRP